jgi:short-subunit dehydrogenase
MMSHTRPIEPRNIFITGASSGIGAALSRRYAGPGITLGLLSRETEKLEAVAAECRQKGAVVHTYTADVTDEGRLRECARDFRSRTSSVDLVVGNAGIRAEEDPEFSDSRVPARIMEVNYIGVINTLVPFIQYMKEQKSGCLVVISSIAAFRGTPNSGAYSASKAAISVWAESLRLRVIPYGIHVCTFFIGFVRTAMTADIVFNMPGIMTADEAAWAIARGVSRRKRTATFPWQNKWIWIAFRLMPGRLYDRVILWAKSRHPERDSVREPKP